MPQAVKRTDDALAQRVLRAVPASDTLQTDVGRQPMIMSTVMHRLFYFFVLSYCGIKQDNKKRQFKRVGMSQNARHNSILNRFGLAATRKSRCTALSRSRRDCLRAACAYRPAGYVSAAVCYDPLTEVPGYFWGARQRAVTRDAPTPVYDKADVVIAQRLLRLDPFPGAGLNRLTAQQTQADPAPLSNEEQRLIAKLRVIA